MPNLVRRWSQKKAPSGSGVALFGAEVEPVTARLSVWCSLHSANRVVDLTVAFARIHVRNTRQQPFTRDSARRWTSDVKPCL